MVSPDAPASARSVWAWLAFVIVVAIATYWPAVHAGFLADDVYQIALSDGLLGPRSPWSLYTLFPAEPEAIAAHVQRGSLPWWTTADFRFVQVRPLSSLLLSLDHSLWPHQSFVHHLHSLLWLATTLAAAFALLRRATTPWIAALALLVFALDETFGWTVAWLANRCSMVAATFAFAALALHLQRRERDSTRRRGLELLAWALAFASGEYALCGLAYALAFSVAGSSIACSAEMAPGVLRSSHNASITLWAGVPGSTSPALRYQRSSTVLASPTPSSVQSSGWR